jgi:predicted NUDIX family NTP pyrophosphohydrolase
MTGQSAGVLLYRSGAAGLEVLLVHPGGPYWRRRDEGAWQMPKGAIEPGEDEATAAIREVREELGLDLGCELLPLGEVRQMGGKRVVGFACAQDFDVAGIVSMEFEMEWPPRSGQRRSFPEVDEARWFSVAEARRMMLPSQRPLLDRLVEQVEGKM